MFGGFSGRFLAGYVSDFFGWREAFVVLAALSLLGALFVRHRLPPSRRFVARRDAAHSLLQLLAHLRNPQLRSVCLTGFCILFCLVGGLTYLMVYLSAAPFSLSSRELGNLFLVYLVGVLVTPLSARAMSQHGLRRILLFALACSACGLSLTLLPSLPLIVIVIGMTVFSSGIFCAQAVAIRRVAEVVRESRSLASGLYGSCYYAGGAAGTWLCASAYVGAGWPAAGGVVLIVLAIAAVEAWIGWKR
ncbi:MAG: MFS transporter [Proteobacteria bacterium]|nr:MFS transporter [Pseudomonadota bacterium]